VRALLVFNPNATTTDDRVRDVIASALASAVDLDVARPSSAATPPTWSPARSTRASTPSSPSAATAPPTRCCRPWPAPGRARHDPRGRREHPRPGPRAARGPRGGDVGAARHLREGRRRTITLGRVAGRYLSLHAGFGFDAQVVRHVEQHATQAPAARRRLRLAVGAGVVRRRGPRPGGGQVRLARRPGTARYAITIVANCDPYTYLGARPMHVHPQASFDTGLDLVGVRPVSTARPAAHPRPGVPRRGHVALPTTSTTGRPRPLRAAGPPAAADGRRGLRRRAPRVALRGRPVRPSTCSPDNTLGAPAARGRRWQWPCAGLVRTSASTTP
jgi:hypothetical protein